MSAGLERQPVWLHAKTMVCDRDIAIVGTANLDNRGFRLDFEVAAIVFGSPVNAALAAAFNRDLHDSRERVRGELDRQGLLRRFGQASARLMSPLL